MGTYAIARTDRIGDLMLSLPVAEAIKAVQPEARVIYIVSPQTGELAAACPFVDNVIQYDENSRDFGEFLRLLSRLRQIKADTALILRPTFMVGLACLLAGIPRRVGTGYRFYSPLFNTRVKEHRKFADKHELDYNLNILRAVIEVQDRRYVPRIEVTETCRAYATQALHSAGLVEKRFVIIHPGSGGSARNLPLRAYAEVAHLIENVLNTRVLVTCGKGETEVIDAMDSIRSRASIRLVDIPNLLELAGVIQQSRLFISGSTGPMHIAAAVGVPTLSFFSPVRSCSPRRWGPVGLSNLVMMPEVPECPTCKGAVCEYFDCMSLIPIDRIRESLVRLLA